MKKFEIIVVTILSCICMHSNVMAGVYGDTDCNGILELLDASNILIKIFNADIKLPVENTNKDYIYLLDVDMDNSITSSDCAHILKKIGNSSYFMPCELNGGEDINNQIKITVKNNNFTATLYDNESVTAFKELLPATYNMSELNGNEKYYFTGVSMPNKPEKVGYINAGDIMLYGDDCIVIFYESFESDYSYTPLGHIDNTLELKEALGSGDIIVSFNK